MRSMGEVRAKARLTNAADEALVRRGMLRPEEVRSHEVDAFVDTGAVCTVLPPDVVARLGLATPGQRVAVLADGRKETVEVTEPFFVELLGRKPVEEAIVLGGEALIGQTVLEKLDLFVDCNGRRVIPNPKHPDQLVTRV